MAVPKHEFTPIAPLHGGLVHATSLHQAGRTACNRPCAGWRVSPWRVTCQACKRRVFMPVGRRAKVRR